MLTDILELLRRDQDPFRTVAIGALAVESDRLGGRGELLGALVDPVVRVTEQDLLHSEPRLPTMHGLHPSWVLVGLVPDVSIQLPAVADSARAARQVVDGLSLHEHDEAAFNLRLLVTELVGNSVRHAGLSSADLITLAIRLSDGLVRVEVADHGPGFQHPSFNGPRPAAVAGHGLHLVDALADRWGTQPTLRRDGWLVWFEIDLSHRLDTERASRHHGN
jgi:anti-sigma regulatory factor (Ser/Thr protein kinase)